MIKNNKGITLTVLIITIVVMLIIASIAINSADSIFTHIRIQKQTTNMLLVRAKVEALNDEYEFNNVAAENYLGIAIEEANKHQLNFYGITIYPDDKWYVIGRPELAVMGLDEDILNETPYKAGVLEEQQLERFIINYSTGEVIYTSGILDVNGDRLYTLTQLIGKTQVDEELPTHKDTSGGNTTGGGNTSGGNTTGGGNTSGGNTSNP